MQQCGRNEEMDERWRQFEPICSSKRREIMIFIFDRCLYPDMLRCQRFCVSLLSSASRISSAPREWSLFIKLRQSWLAYDTLKLMNPIWKLLSHMLTYHNLLHQNDLHNRSSCHTSALSRCIFYPNGTWSLCLSHTVRLSKHAATMMIQSQYTVVSGLRSFCKENDGNEIRTWILE